MEIHVTHSSSGKINNEMKGACNSNGASKSAYTVLVGKTEGKGQRDTARCRWENNIKTYLKIEDRVAWNVLIWFRIGTGNE